MNQTNKNRFQALLNDVQASVQIGDEALSHIHANISTLNGFILEESVNGYYRPKYYKLYELLPKDVYDELNDNGILEIGWYLFDSRFLWTIDALREKWNTATYVNTWYIELKNIFQEQYNYSGYRNFDCLIGAKWSQHKFGRAGDLKIPSLSIDNIINDMKNNPDDPAYKYITAVESKVKGKTPSWLHIDIRNCKRIKFISIL